MAPLKRKELKLNGFKPEEDQVLTFKLVRRSVRAKKCISVAGE